MDQMCGELKDEGWIIEREKLHHLFWGLSFLEEKSSEVIECIESLLTSTPAAIPIQTPSRPSRGRKGGDTKINIPKSDVKSDRVAVASKLWSNMIERYRVTILDFEEVEDFEKRNPIILILDKCLQQFPWECLPVLRTSSQPVCRLPSISFADSLLSKEMSHPIVRDGVDPKRVYFIINPDGNDEKKGFRAQQKERWKVTLKSIGRKEWRGLQDTLPCASHFQTGSQVRSIYFRLKIVYLNLFQNCSFESHFLIPLSLPSPSQRTSIFFFTLATTEGNNMLKRAKSKSSKAEA